MIANVRKIPPRSTKTLNDLVAALHGLQVTDESRRLVVSLAYEMGRNDGRMESLEEMRKDLKEIKEAVPCLPSA